MGTNCWTNWFVLCEGFERISRIESNYMQEGIVPFVVDGVYAMAHALNNMMADTCGSHARMCDAMKPPEGSVLLSYIRNVSFIGKSLDSIGWLCLSHSPHCSCSIHWQMLKISLPTALQTRLSRYCQSCGSNGIALSAGLTPPGCPITP